MPNPTLRARSRRSCRSACWARSNTAPANGAKSPATALTAGSSRTSCGAFIRTRRSSDVFPSALLLPPQPYHHIDPRDLITLRRHRRLADENFVRRDVHEIVLVFDEEVVVLGIVGVEIGF